MCVGRRSLRLYFRLRGGYTSDMSDHDGEEFGDFGVEGMDWSDTADLTALEPDELRVLLGRLSEEEKVLSYRRRLLQGRIDLIRAELVLRGEASLSPEDLARILMGPESSGGGADEPTGGEVR